MLSRKQLSPTEASVRPNSSLQQVRALCRRKPRQQIRTAARQRKPEAFDRLKGPAIVDFDRGSASCGTDPENATGCMGCSSELASRVTQPSIIPSSVLRACHA